MPELTYQHAHWFPDMAEVVSREDAEKEITRLRAALRVACEEINAWRLDNGFHKYHSIQSMISARCGVCAAKTTTDATIDLATGEPRTP